MPSQFHIILQPELLEKHGWKANDAILTEEETVFEELKEYKVDGDQESPGLVHHLYSLYSGRSHCWWGHTELHQSCSVALRRTGDTMISLLWLQLVILSGQPWALFIHGLCWKGRQQRDSFGKGSVWHFPWTSTRENCFALQCFALSGKRMWCQGVLPAIWQTNRYISLNRNDLPSEENFGCGIL